MRSKWHVSTAIITPLLVVSGVGCGTPPVEAVSDATEAPVMAQFFAPELGKGVDAAETRTFIKCVTFSQTSTERLPFSKRLYQDYSVSTRKELDKKLDLSASTSAKGLWGEGGGTVSYFKDKVFDADAFYWVVDANYELVHESLPTNDPNFGLTERAKSLLRSPGGIEGFKKACGTHFYVGRTLGGRYVMLYEFRSHQDKFVENIKATARAKANFGLDGETELARAIDSARRSAFMKVSTEVTGGDATLDAYASDPNLLKGELLKLRTALESGSGHVLDWEMVSYEVFEEFQEAEREANTHLTFDTARRDALEYYYNTYTNNQQQLAELRALLKRAEGDAPQLHFGTAKRTAMRASMDSLQAQNNAISRRARVCLSTDTPCPVDNLPPLWTLTDEQREPDRDYTGLAGWSLTPYPRRNGQAYVDFFATPPNPKCNLRFFSTGNDVTSSSRGLMAQVKRGGTRPQNLCIGTAQLLREGQTHYTPDICVGEFGSVCSLRLIEDFKHTLDDGCPQPRLELSIFDESGFCTDRLTFRMFQ